jgi:hypothetical protein
MKNLRNSISVDTGRGQKKKSMNRISNAAFLRVKINVAFVQIYCTMYSPLYLLLLWFSRLFQGLDSSLATPLSKHACVQGRGGDRQATRPPPPPTPQVMMKCLLDPLTRLITDTKGCGGLDLT